MSCSWLKKASLYSGIYQERALLPIVIGHPTIYFTVHCTAVFTVRFPPETSSFSKNVFRSDPAALHCRQIQGNAVQWRQSMGTASMNSTAGPTTEKLLRPHWRNNTPVWTSNDHSSCIWPVGEHLFSMQTTKSRVSCPLNHDPRRCHTDTWISCACSSRCLEDSQKRQYLLWRVLMTGAMVTQDMWHFSCRIDCRKEKWYSDITHSEEV